jgi:hypothetical protein
MRVIIPIVAAVALEPQVHRPLVHVTGGWSNRDVLISLGYVPRPDSVGVWFATTMRFPVASQSRGLPPACLRPAQIDAIAHGAVRVERQTHA